MGKYEINKHKDGEFQFKLKAGNGQIILSSEFFTSRDDVKNAINSVKKNVKDDKRFKRLESKTGKRYFNLTDDDDEILGTSEMYESVFEMENGIDSVKKNAPRSKLISKKSKSE